MKEKKTEKIGIYGGTFSPVHAGHLHAAEIFLEKMALDRLFLIPSAIPPHKQAVEGASPDDRLAMLSLACRTSEALSSERVTISDFELKRKGKSYTYYTLKHFCKRGRKIYLLVGTDMFLSFDTWFRAPELFKMAEIVLMRREDDEAASRQIAEKAEEYERLYAAKLHFLDAEPLEVSSTELREAIRAGKPTGDLLPKEVSDYIREHHLYDAESRKEASAK